MQDSSTLLPSAPGGSPYPGFDPSSLLAPREALEAYFARAAIAAPSVERVSLDAAAGGVLAEDAISREDHPSHPRSTMDGFALRSADGVAPRRIVGEVLMGAAAPGTVGPGEAMRVPTGGAIPDGADAVVAQEDVAVTGDGSLVLREAIPAGDCITPRADDVRAGEVVLRAGRRLGAPELGVLATLGIARVPVFVQPRIAILSTGDELVDPDRTPGVGQVRDSNRYAIAGSLAALGARPVHVARSADTPEALRAALRRALDDCDAVFTTGGSSVGERDLVPRIVAELGTPGPIVHGLRVKPGKPTLLAAVDGKPVIGLPGNPASSLMILEAVVWPIVSALCGDRSSAPIVLGARAVATFAGRPGWTWFVPVRLRSRAGELEAEPLAIRSSQASLLARSAGYVIIDNSVGRVQSGDRVNVTLFSCGGAPIEAE
jgi:molybdopterin molybdotransferase